MRPFFKISLPLACLTLLAVWFLTSAAEPPKTSVPEAAKPSRVPWTTSRVTGSPEPPPPYKAVRVFPNVKLVKPLLMARCESMDRLFVGEEAGVLYSFANTPDAKAELFLDLRKEVKTLAQLPGAVGISKVYGLAFHPQFAKNRQCFVCYTVSGKERKKGNFPDGTRVSRFTVPKADPPRIDASTEEVVFSFPEGGHNGGDIHFGNDGMLYISTGDGSGPNPPDSHNTGQDVSDLLSSVLRIDVDRKDEGKSYAIPNDNPFVSLKGARPEVWAYGFRNPWRMSFDRPTGDLYVGDVGWDIWEMIQRVEKGGNYGWSATEGPTVIKPDQVGPTPIRRALIDLPHSIACSITGGYVYHGKKFP
ncbi:MAG: PQQ-dependent sugar dehydrogenase, partial [Planctomycetes bacterium]|nr:PQQ-dependent sugar dehydrogenase [Planctomycetota bacterium]